MFVALLPTRLEQGATAFAAAHIPCPCRDEQNAGITSDAKSSRCACAHRGGNPGGASTNISG